MPETEMEWNGWDKVERCGECVSDRINGELKCGYRDSWIEKADCIQFRPKPHKPITDFPTIVR